MEANRYPGHPDLWGVFGQRSALRVIDPSNPEDLQRVKEIEEYPNADYIFGIKRRSPDLIRKWITRKQGMIYGVCDPKADEPKCLQGWVSVENEAFQSQLIEVNGLSAGPVHSAIELMYIKHPLAPNGLMSSAVRQVCTALLLQRIHQMHEVCDPVNFMPPVFVQIHTSNGESQQVAESAGIQKATSEVILPGGGVNILYSIYMLNWSILNSSLHNSSDARLLQALKG